MSTHPEFRERVMLSKDVAKWLEKNGVKTK